MTRREFLFSSLFLPALPRLTAAARLPSATARPLFRDAAAESGLSFRHYNCATGEHFMPEIMGPGVALFDYDNDGDLDIYLIQGTPLAPGKKLLFPPQPGWKPGNRLFRNLLAETGKLKFEDVTENAGVGHVGYGMGAAVGDYDNDGYQDLYVTNFGHNVLYHNNGNGTFTEVTQQAGVDDPRWSTSASWVDYDGDGRLDLFVCNYVDFTVQGNKQCFSPTGAPDYCTPIAYNAVPSRLFHNLGNGKFEDVSLSSGIASSYGPGLGVICADFNGDGLIDIYVADDTAANRLWINQGNGAFKEEALDDGVAYSGDGLAKAGMGVTLGDAYNDGHLELLVTNLTREGVTLFRGDGKGFFDDITAQSRLLQATYGYTGFGTQFFDYDNDGLLDLFIANGAVTISNSLREAKFPYNENNQLFHNEGTSFREVTPDAGPAFALSEVSRGAAFGDIDNDGRMDFVISNNNGPARLMLNQSESKGHWLEVRLEKAGGNRFGIGSRVGVFRKGESTLWRRAHTDGSYLSSSDVRVHFGLGNNPRIEAVVVEWPGGPRERWERLKADRLVVLHQGSGRRP
ncbi:MAG: CRTAC1 family protein [Acidobacteriota bacterium]|nr:CRTAC1 family protein [Acidobacteriota bacterium]